MRTMLVFVMVLALMGLAGTAGAQTTAAKPAATGPEISAADVAAVAVYREAMGKLRVDLKAAQAEIKEKNIALAKALGKGGDYNEKEVAVRHAELMAAQQRLATVELGGFLLYKKYNPSWKPDVSGRKVGTSEPAKGGKRPAPESADPLEDDEL